MHHIIISDTMLRAFPALRTLARTGQAPSLMARASAHAHYRRYSEPCGCCGTVHVRPATGERCNRVGL